MLVKILIVLLLIVFYFLGIKVLKLVFKLIFNFLYSLYELKGVLNEKSLVLILGILKFL